MNEKIKILGILGSPNKNGGTAQFLLAALKGAKREGATTESIWLYEKEILPCKGCINDEEPECKFPCIYEDFGKEILIKIKEADGVIFATPIYWFAPSGPMKILIDRMTSLENMVAFGEPSYMEGKVVGTIAVGADAGGPWVGGYLITTLTCMGAIVPPWGIAYCHNGKQAIYNEKRLLDAINVGILVTRMVQVLKGQKKELTFVDDEKMLKEIQREVIEELGLKDE